MVMVGLLNRALCSEKTAMAHRVQAARALKFNEHRDTHHKREKNVSIRKSSIPGTPDKSKSQNAGPNASTPTASSSGATAGDAAAPPAQMLGGSAIIVRDANKQQPNSLGGGG